jgi:hypothetical protein
MRRWAISAADIIRVIIKKYHMDIIIKNEI